ncbi:phage major capsid protein [Sphingobacterium sp. InxBP1]|uniref:phage major capsid protein n=1 Tax=Sphingobacterium sp. InxBP1 TaxID=2870328 RepID=UPI002244E7FA|nr:phage major capsid protein [Sphingobacterium sp. InxBP1]MCW8309898.1 phage major capsid protein [Sphingobacterium sp. InxBP1]
MDEKEKEALEKVKAAQKEAAEEATKGFKAQLDEAEKKAKSAEDRAEKAENKVKELEGSQEEMQKHLDQLDLKLQNGGGSGKGESLEKMLEKSKDAIAAVKSGERGGFQNVVSFEKAATDITVTGFQGDASAYVPAPVIEPGLNQAPRIDYNIMNYADTQSTSSPVIVWINKVNEEGHALFIGEGDLKPLRSFGIAKETSNAKKIAVRFRVSTEALDDVPFLASEIRKDGIMEVDEQTAAKLLTGTGTGDEPKGLTLYAVPYSLTTIKGEDPDRYGAIRAAIAQVRSMKFRANAAFINPIDAANMDLKKAGTGNGQYVLPPFTTADGQRIGATAIVESDEIPVGKVLVGDMTRFHIRMYKGKQVQIGLDGDDFSHNMRTVLVEQRLHAYVKSVDQGAFVYDDFANIIAALTPAP